jgi:hypothetical protein
VRPTKISGLKASLRGPGAEFLDVVGVARGGSGFIESSLNRV